MTNSNTSVPAADSGSMKNEFPWHWSLKDLPEPTCGKVFTTFACGGGSSMGYKRAGFEVVGAVEIDPKIAAMYRANHHPEFFYRMDLRNFNTLPDAELPEELFGIDILDGSPPCTVFSTAGKREAGWGVAKQFREGQAKQRLDDLFFVFIETVRKLQPKVVVAENVPGLLHKNAQGYVNQIIREFRDAGYDVQIFSLNTAYMDVPQARHRVFFIANRMGFPKLKLDFHNRPIPFGEVRSEHGVPVSASTVKGSLMAHIQPGDKTLEDVYFRLTGRRGKFFTDVIVHDKNVAFTVASGSFCVRGCDGTMFSAEDYTAVQSFPYDYDFCGNDVRYVTGMSVPPNAMAHIAQEIYRQWLRK